MHAARRRLAFLAAAVLLGSASCPLSTVQIRSPRSGLLTDDPGLAVEVRIGRNFAHADSVVRVDGVDLAAALGLAPPFTGGSGAVAIGSDVVTVSDFHYVIPPTSDPIRITAVLAGLSIGAHVLEVEAQPRVGGAPTVKTSSFAVAAPFTLESEVLAASGTPPGGPIPSGNRASIATLGEPLAAPPVGLEGGGALRAGFVPAAQARAGGP